MEEKELVVKRAMWGDKQAFEQLFLTERTKLYYNVWSYVKESSDAQDIVQETFYPTSTGSKTPTSILEKMQRIGG